MAFDASFAPEVTDEFRERLDACMGNSNHGLLYPVAFVEVTGALTGRKGTWIGDGGRILVRYESDRSFRSWYAVLCHDEGNGTLWTNGFTAMTDRPSEKLASAVDRAVGLTLDELAEIYLACVPERFREGMRETGVPV